MGGRIGEDLVEAETRLRWLWTREVPAKPAEKIDAARLLGRKALAALDRFDQLPLQPCCWMTLP